MLSTLLSGIDPGISVKVSIAIGLVFFSAIVLIVYRPSQRQPAEKAGRMPLQED